MFALPIIQYPSHPPPSFPSQRSNTTHARPPARTRARARSLSHTHTHAHAHAHASSIGCLDELPERIFQILEDQGTAYTVSKQFRLQNSLEIVLMPLKPQ